MSEDYEEVFAEQVLGWGCLGRASEREALALSVPLWVAQVDDPEAVVWLCLRALEQDWPEVQVAALKGIVDLLHRFSGLPQLEELVHAVVRLLEHTDDAVRAAAMDAHAALMADNG